MRALAICALLVAIAVASCAPPGDLSGVEFSHEDDTLRTVCDDIEALADDMYDDGDMASTKWVSRIDDLGIRAVGLDTNDGELLAHAIARWSVGLENQDLDFAAEGLDDIDGICF